MRTHQILACTILTALAATAAAAQEPLPAAGAETIDVDLKTVPFYAVDAAGQPVFDLVLDELEIRVDGELATPDTLDRWETASGVSAPPAAAGAPAGAASPSAARQARQVFLLFDQAFSLPTGWQRSQRLATDLVGELPASDRLYLLLHDSTGGLRYLKGPVTDAAGRAALREVIDSLGSGALFLRAHLEQTGLPPLLGPSGNTGVGGQEKNAYEAAGRLARAEYQATAVTLADAFEALAAHFEQMTAPKLLLLFSSGIESDFYFEGTYGFAPGSSLGSYYHGRSVRLEPISGRYERSLAVLASAGVVPIFVNPESSRAMGSDTLHHMSQVTGGLFIDGGKLKTIESGITAASSAYYEAGFYLRQQPALDQTAKIEIEVRRPGVRVIFPNRLRNRQQYAALSDTQKQFVIVDLVRSGAPSSQIATLHTLEGQLLRQQGKPRVAFAASWPETIRGKEIELYDVTLEVGEGEPQLVRFDRRQLAAAAEPLRVEKTLPRGKTLVWGIVAVEPASGEAYLRRLHFEPES